jgi:formyltetrahydrofolate deformylase
MSEANATLLLSCPDRKGIIAGVSNFIFNHGGNIIHADQHTSLTKKLFFMRIEWELNGFSIPRGEILNVFEPLRREFDMKGELYFSDEIPRRWGRSGQRYRLLSVITSKRNLLSSSSD